MGAAIQGGIIAGAKVNAVLVDITSHSLGIKAMHLDWMAGPRLRFSPILHRNTPLPASRSEVYYTMQDEQETVEIEVYQGENEDVRFNHLIGKFLAEGLAPVPAGNEILVQFDTTLDGTLRVAARERATGLERHITINNALARFQREERAQARERLEQLWQPEGPLADSAAPAASDGTPPAAAASAESDHRAAVQARALLEKAQRLLEKLATQDQAELQVQMERLQKALSERHWDQVAAASNQLADTLFYLEDQ
jgi:molecular chaperone DnaK